jgi:Domain of unknown function (DUF6378)
MSSTSSSWKPEDYAMKAAELISGERAQQHGDFADTYSRVSVLWTAWLKIRQHPERELNARDVLIMMALMKLGRRESGNLNKDNPVDEIGYTALSASLDCLD